MTKAPAMIVRAARTARRAEQRTLRQSIWGLEHVHIRSAQNLVAWLDRLSDLSREEWLAVGHAARSEPSRCERLCAARVRLDAIVCEYRLELLAWFVRDFVETAVHQGLQHDTANDRQSRVVASAARDAAYVAGMATASRDWLTDSDYDVLSAPFAVVIGT